MLKSNRRIRYSWIIASACFSIQAIGVGTYVSFGVFFNSLEQEFGWSRAVLSGAASTAYLLMGFLGIYVGRLNDIVGPRRMMSVTSVFFGVGLLCMSGLNEIWQLYAFFGVIVGIGLSSIDVIALSTIARWFKKTRGLMTGIVKVGTGVGQFSLPLIAGLLIVSFGWRVAYLILGIGVGVLLLLIAQFLRRDPSDIAQTDEKQVIIGAERVGRPAVSGYSLQEAIQTPQFRIICAINVLVVYSFMTVIVHIVPRVQDTGVSAAKAAGVLSVIGAVSMLGRFFIGMTIDRFGSKKALQISLILLVLVLLWLQFADHLWMFYLFASIYGLAHGSFFTAISPAVAELFGIRAHGVLFGIVAFCGTLGGAIGPVSAGYLFDLTGKYEVAFGICFLISIIGLLLTQKLKRTLDLV